MASTPDYGKWIRDALASNPRLSKAGLTRHLGHGQDRGRVLKMIAGQRRIQIEELPQIAAYLGIPPPGVPLTAIKRDEGVPMQGRIAPGVWIEAGLPQPPQQGRYIPPVIDERWPVRDQMAFDLADGSATASLLPGDTIVAVAWAVVRQAPQPGDLIVTVRKRSDLEQYALARAKPGLRGVDLAPVLDKSLDAGGDLGKPFALVIQIIRPTA